MVWEQGVLARGVAVVAVVSYAVAWALGRWSGGRRLLRWKRDFLREEGLELPPVPWELGILVRPAST